MCAYMRYLPAIALASLAAIACGNASPDSTEQSASTGADLIIPNPGSSSCYSGYVYQCHVMVNRVFCGCEPLSCNFEDSGTPPNGTVEWIESWTMGSQDGSCPDIAAPTGTWKELSNAVECTTEGSFFGVPCEWYARGNPQPAACNPSNFGTPSCCTYVWWPNGFVADASCAAWSNECPAGTAAQFPQVLCLHAGMTLKANEREPCFAPDGGAINGGCGGIGGGGTCRTCSSP
jgi:hypothetical protein